MWCLPQRSKPSRRFLTVLAMVWEGTRLAPGWQPAWKTVDQNEVESIIDRAQIG